VSKLKLHALDLTVEGERPEATSQHALVNHQKVAARKGWLPVTRDDVVRNAMPVAALAFSVAAIALWFTDRPAPPPAAETPRVTTLAAPPGAEHKPKTKPAGGTLEFKPALAPDPALVLTARRMLPQAWRECHGASADKAVEACKLLLDSGIAKGDELAEIHLSNGKALRDRHELDKALEAFSASLALAPTSAAFSLRGNVHYDKSNWDKAIADYSDTIRLDPQNGEAFNNRAWTYYRAGRQAEALEDANNAVRLLAKEAYVWDTRGHVNAKLGNRDAAIKDFRAALAIDPANNASKDGLASLGAN
jgi:tetratricopeptide (TPR) repeat protein